MTHPAPAGVWRRHGAPWGNRIRHPGPPGRCEGPDLTLSYDSVILQWCRPGTIAELTARVAAALADDAGPDNRRIRAVPDERAIRYYTTLGLLDRPALTGRTAFYGPRHLAPARGDQTRPGRRPEPGRDPARPADLRRRHADGAIRRGPDPAGAPGPPPRLLARHAPAARPAAAGRRGADRARRRGRDPHRGRAGPRECGSPWPWRGPSPMPTWRRSPAPPRPSSPKPNAVTSSPRSPPMIPIAIEPSLHYVRCDGGWGALDTALGRLPLAAVDLDVRVMGLAMTTEVRQVFVNHHATPLEATYVFPLPDRAAVQRFRMTAGDRVIEGELDERGAARDTYQAAIAAGHRAALAEEDRAGVFTMTVGNLMPGDVVTIALTLSGPLPIDDGEVTWQFPLVVAPRYMPGAALPGEQAGLGIAHDTTATPDASRISPPVLLPGLPSPVRLGVRLTIDGGGLPLSGLRANLAEVEARADGATWLLALRPGQRLDRDLVLRWRLGGAALTLERGVAPRPGRWRGRHGRAHAGATGRAGRRWSPARRRDRPRPLGLDGGLEDGRGPARQRPHRRQPDRARSLRGDRLRRSHRDPASPGRRARHRQRSPSLPRGRVPRRGRVAGRHRAGPTPWRWPPSSCVRIPDAIRCWCWVTDGQVGNEDQLVASLGRSPGPPAGVHAGHRSGGQRRVPAQAGGPRRRRL
jgi:hypothetical protein